MSNAARALALVTHSLHPDGRIVGVAGSGHNGGDTRLALQTLSAWGRETAILDAASDDVDSAALFSASVILDGIFGTGMRGEPRMRARHWINAMNAAARPIIAVDLPSAFAVAAHVTVTFGFPKLEMLFPPNRQCCGRIICVEMGFPPLPYHSAQLITPAWAAAHLPERAPNANKGTSGRLLLVAGSSGMAGAAVIAGRAAARSGAGLVRIVSTADNREIIQRSVPQATFFDHQSYDSTAISAVVAGPGLGPNARDLIDDVVKKIPRVPMVLDADGLNAFEGNLEHLKQIAGERPLVLTPHPKELSRLIGVSVKDIVSDPARHAHHTAQELGAVVLLKGQPSVVASREEPTLINTTGSSDVAVAGMGDQLSGVIGAFVAAGGNAREATAAALFFAGRAADIANLGRALTPDDVTDALPRAFVQPGGASSPLRFPFITFDQPARW